MNAPERPGNPPEQIFSRPEKSRFFLPNKRSCGGARPIFFLGTGRKSKEFPFPFQDRKAGDSMAKGDNEGVKLTDVESLTVSAAVLGDTFGVSDRRIRQMAEEGIISRVAKGRYNYKESVKNYILSLKLAADASASENPDGELDFNEEKALHERVKRHISELKYQTMKGELHKAEDVQKVMTDMLTAFKTRILNIPAKASPLLANRSEVGYIKDVLTKEVLEALNELKEYDPKMFYSDEYVDGPDDEE